MQKYLNLMTKSVDVYLIVNELNKIAWNVVKESSINRILYITAVMYSFVEPNKKNIFKEDYKFIVTLSGPEDADIGKALINLEANEYIIREKDGFCVTEKDNYNSIDRVPMFYDKKQWIEDIVYIIGIYGEDKVYDFIFRDPEYNYSFKSNSVHILDLDKSNETIKFLNEFKAAFEEKNFNTFSKIDNRKYLEMYFEYVFGKILRGE